MKKRRTASCPSCAGPVQFGPGAVVTVCDYCQSAVARGDKEVEDYGKVADLVETSSRMRRGLTGKYRDKPFNVFGHVQYRHPAGGIWDEWYLAFPAGKWGWLAEAQGKIYLLFERRLTGKQELPSFESLSVGREVHLGDTRLEVIERGVAEAIAAEGEIPWGFRSGAEHRFADLRGDDGAFATFEYGHPPSAYIGEEVSLDSLQLEGEGWHIEQQEIKVSATTVNCPNCGGSLALCAPDQSLRVVCPSCNSLLDAEHGKLSYFKTLRSKESFRIAIPLGSEGTLFGNKYTVIGFMKRYALWEGKQYPWNEYLLYEPSIGFRWLVHNNGHWSFVEPLTDSVAPSQFSASSIYYDGDSFRMYDHGTAYVRYVVGEFYWKVEVGEKVQTADFIAPPRMISFEKSDNGQSEEVNISLGRYVTTEEIEDAFGIGMLAIPWGVGVIQPAPKFHLELLLMWFSFVAILVGFFVATVTREKNTGSDPWLCFFAIVLVSLVPIGLLVMKYSFEVNRWRDSEFSPYSTE